MVSNYQNQGSPGSSTGRNMSPDQFDQVVKAIIEGKYSWACVLFLRSAGYNPAHYIPYRTYKRLIKDNRPQPSLSQPTPQAVPRTESPPVGLLG